MTMENVVIIVILQELRVSDHAPIFDRHMRNSSRTAMVSTSGIGYYTNYGFAYC